MSHSMACPAANNALLQTYKNPNKRTKFAGTLARAVMLVELLGVWEAGGHDEVGTERA